MDINEESGVVKLLKKHSQVNINIHSLNDVGLESFARLNEREESDVHLMKYLGGAGRKADTDVAQGNSSTLFKEGPSTNRLRNAQGRTNACDGRRNSWNEHDW